MALQAVTQQSNSQAREVDPVIADLARVYESPYDVELYEHIEPKINLNYITSKMARLYEQLRYTVDYKEEHLLRRSAIERITKRIIFMNRKNPRVIAETLLHELIRAQYLPNDAIPEAKALDLAKIIDKYLRLYDQLGLRYPKEKLKDYHRFLWEIMAAEIEESIIPPKREDALVETLYKVIKPRINLLNYQITDQELNIQLYLAIHRNIIKSDSTILSYYLFKLYFPHWEQVHDITIIKVADNFDHVLQTIKQQLNHPLAELLMRRTHNWSAYFTVLNDVLAENREHLRQTLSYTSELEDEIKKAANKRYAAAKKKLKRGAVRSVLYIFFTKVLLAIAIELPYDKFFLGHINYVALGSNVFFHPLLMASIVLTTRVPKGKNTEKIVDGIKKAVYGDEIPPIIVKFKKSAQFGSASWLFITIFYLFIYLLTFGAIITIMVQLGFNIVSGFMFVLFLTLISFFGIRLRVVARDLSVLKRKENVISFLFDLFTLPIIRAGRWITIKSKSINVFIFILDFIIESPYKFIVASFEDITSFVKQKKEEVD